MIRGAGTERIIVGDEMPANAVRIDELDDGGFLGNIGIQRRIAAGADLLIGLPANREKRNPEIAKHLIVEVIFAEQQLTEFGQEGSGFRALNNAMVIRA